MVIGVAHVGTMALSILRNDVTKKMVLRLPNKSLETDCKGRFSLRLDLLPKMIQFQLCATREITGVAGLPRNMLILEQLLGWHKGALAYSLAAAQFQR